MLGEWDVKVAINSFPEKVATALGDLNNLMGAEYTPFAYLGSQIVNGTNHAVLAEQLVVTGKDTKNIVLIILRETPQGTAITNIERVVEGGDGMGAVTIDVQTDIPEEATKAFDFVLGEFVGASVKPFAYLASQITKGTNYIFAATVKPVTLEGKDYVAIVTVNPLEKKASFTDILKSNLEVSLGKPLGEWP